MTVKAMSEETPSRQENPIHLAWKWMVSLRLTVTLFALSVLLVFFGTLAQKESGIWYVVRDYFWSWVVWVPNHLISEFLKIFGLGLISENARWEGSFPLPGGKTLGILLFVNLVCGFLKVFLRDLKYPQRRWRLPGLALLHFGLLLLMVGEFITREFAVEGQMTIVNGGSSNFVERRDRVELAFLAPDPASPDSEKVIAIPESMLKEAFAQKKKISDPKLPVEIEILDFQANSALEEKPGAEGNPADRGDGLEIRTRAIAQVSGADPNQKIDLPSIYIKLTDPKTGKPLGTWLATTWTSLFPNNKTQTIDLGLGKENPVFSLRFERLYKPYTISLVKFIHDLYPGTDIPKNYQSDIVLDDPDLGINRPVTIKMNEPMRHAGETFFQSSFLPGDEGTILQVVKNPGWLLPYLSCILVSLGMMVHFGAALIQFFQKLKAGPAHRTSPVKISRSVPTITSGGNSLWPTVIWVGSLGFGALSFMAITTAPATKPKGFDIKAFGDLPMLEGGRVKPIDTLARNRLMLFSQRQEVSLDTKDEGKDKQKANPAEKAESKMQASQWLLEVMTSRFSSRSKADELAVFRIDFDQVRKSLNLETREGLRYSIEDLRKGGRLENLMMEASKASKVNPKVRDIYQVRVLELANNLSSYMEVQTLGVPHMFPPENWDGVTAWAPVGEILGEVGQAIRDKKLQEIDPVKRALAEIFIAYAEGNPDKFNEMVKTYRAGIEKWIPQTDLKRSSLEAQFNAIQPFYLAFYFYGFALLFTLLGWIVAGISLSANETTTTGGSLLQHLAWSMNFQALSIHTLGLIMRMMITGRPPVTNLYTSAIFIGWGICVLGILVEFVFRRGLGNILPAVSGIATLIIAQNLSAGGDTMEVLQAVLDTNFWLATHVTTITLGYSATYVAGLVGVVYILARCLNLFLPQFASSEKEMTKACNNLMYGVVCFATLLSFVGTVLGGIWADQSWGRFWGWDPKENGAVLIVIWNALILHARWGGLIKTNGLAILTLVGNIITTWSWFGTNQLGVGLHAYGFNNTLASGCMLFWLSQLTLIILGGIISLKDRTEEPRSIAAQ